MFANSADGNDIYILSFKAIEKKAKGGTDLAVKWIDSKSGESITKEFPGTGYGYIYTMYANNKYLFLYTTSLPLSRDEIEKEPVNTKLYRLEKKTMEMVLLEDEMKNASQFPRVFWQIFRVENDFYEAYIVKEAVQHIVIALARFDNNGKMIKSEDISFDLKQSFARQENSGIPLNAGINNGINYSEKYSDNLSHDYVYIDPLEILIYPLSSCHLHFDPVSKNYYAFGLCGNGEQKTVATDYSGFYIARIDEDFKLGAFKEYAGNDLLEKDAVFRIHTKLGTRAIDASRTPTDQLVIMIRDLTTEFYFSIEPASLEIKKSMKLPPHKDHQEIFQHISNTFTCPLNKELYLEPELLKPKVMGKIFFMFQPHITNMWY
ncbi:MAG: hypothetical protein M3R17_05155 [Bacteroidota bacterium]|nr:hypothetical protein [Bacteroidota bacterium]